MKRWFSNSELRGLSWMMAAIILAGSMSLAMGVALASGPVHPELTINICQPLQVSMVATSTLLARPAPPVSDFAVKQTGSTVIGAVTLSGAEPCAPDTPPPRPII
jgi:hypothetical protein